MREPWTPPEDRSRPDADLAQITIMLDWQTIVISGPDEAGLGRIFMWLMVQSAEARG